MEGCLTILLLILQCRQENKSCEVRKIFATFTTYARFIIFSEKRKREEKKNYLFLPKVAKVVSVSLEEQGFYSCRYAFST